MNLGLSLGLAARAAIDYPATLNLTGWWRASYSTAPWVGSPSAGISASNNLVLGSEPGTGTIVNGYAPAGFDGVSDYLLTAATTATLMSQSLYSWVILAKAASAEAPAGTNPKFIAETSAVYDMPFSTSGVSWRHVDAGGTTRTVGPLACSVGVYHLITAGYDGANIFLNVDGVDATPFACTNLFNLLTNQVRVGRGAGTSHFMPADILEIMVAAQDLRPSIPKIRSYVDARYGLSI